MPLSKTGLANLALGELGADLVEDIDSDDSRPAELCRTHFDTVRDAVLEDRDWSFAMDRWVLPKSSTPPAFGYLARFPMPATILRVVTVDAGDEGDVVDAFMAAMDPAPASGLDWVKEGRFILANTTGANVLVTGVKQAVDPSTWPAAFAQAFVARLAHELAVPVTQDHGRSVELWKLYQEKLQAASSSDGRQGRSQRIKSSWLRQRRV